jgi:hypothetical protein
MQNLDGMGRRRRVLACVWHVCVRMARVCVAVVGRQLVTRPSLVPTSSSGDR